MESNLFNIQNIVAIISALVATLSLTLAAFIYYAPVRLKRNSFNSGLVYLSQGGLKVNIFIENHLEHDLIVKKAILLLLNSKTRMGTSCEESLNDTVLPPLSIDHFDINLNLDFKKIKDIPIKDLKVELLIVTNRGSRVFILNSKNSKLLNKGFLYLSKED